jgi:hypothetical protein
MHVRNLLKGQRLLSRVVVSSALLGSMFVVGLATAASAAGTTHMAFTSSYSTTVQSGQNFGTPFQVSFVDNTPTVDTTNTSLITATVAVAGVTVSSGSVNAVLGVANFPSLWINAPVGTYTVTFSSPSLTSINSTLITVNIGPASKLELTTQPSAGAITGVAIPRQPVVKVTDSGGNVITSVNTGTSTATISTGVGVVSAGSPSSTFTAGVATFSGLTLTGASGTFNTLSFSGPFASVVSNSITMSGVATHLVITTQPSTTAGTGIALVQQPIVKIEDALNNVVVADSSVMVAIASPSASLTLTNGAVNVVNGVATYVGLAINAPIGSYTLTFANGTFTSVPSTAIAIAAGAASKLVVTTEPSSFIASGVAMAQQPVVKVEDASGNVVTTVSTGSATVTIFSGVGGTLTAGAAANFTAGVATFSGLTLTGVAGNTYKLTFTGATFGVNDATSIVVGAAQAALSVTSTNAVWGRTLTLTATGGSGTGALTYAVAAGTATGCAVVGTALTYSSLGTCLVTVTKAADLTYVAASSPAVTVTIAKLPLYGTVRVTFAKNSSGLSATAEAALLKLVGNITSESHLRVTGYAPRNLALAQHRATAVVIFLQGMVHASFARSYQTRKNLQAADVKTVRQ